MLTRNITDDVNAILTYIQHPDGKPVSDANRQHAFKAIRDTIYRAHKVSGHQNTRVFNSDVTSDKNDLAHTLGQLKRSKNIVFDFEGAFIIGESQYQYFPNLKPTNLPDRSNIVVDPAAGFEVVSAADANEDEEWQQVRKLSKTERAKMKKIRQSATNAAPAAAGWSFSNPLAFMFGSGGNTDADPTAAAAAAPTSAPQPKAGHRGKKR